MASRHRNSSANPGPTTPSASTQTRTITHNYRHFRKHSRDLETTQKALDKLSRVELECSQVIAARRITEEVALIELERERQGGPDQPGIRVTIGDKVVRLARF